MTIPAARPTGSQPVPAVRARADAIGDRVGEGHHDDGDEGRQGGLRGLLVDVRQMVLLYF